MAQEVYFEQVVARGCGLDVHKETVVATVSVRKWDQEEMGPVPNYLVQHER